MNNSDNFFEELQIQMGKELPFVAYRKPGDGTIKAFCQKNDNLHIVKDFSEIGFVFAPFDDKKDPVIIPEEHSEFLATNTDFVETEDFSETKFISAEGDDSSREQYKELVEKAKKTIKSRALKKVVISRKEQLEIQNAHPLKIFRKLLKKYDSAFIYCWYHPKVGLWLGATPETLLTVERNRFKTMSLAGTQMFNGTHEVLWGKKEIEEQKMVTDSILVNLLDISAQRVETTKPYTAKAGSLLHLRTDITGEYKNSEFQIPNSKFPNSGSEIKRNSSISQIGKLIAAIHPTPAVCGIPRESAKQFILEKENYDREFYTGFLGELNIKNEKKRSGNRRNQENQAYAAVVRSSALFVNLRCMKLDENRAYIFVGGGITKDSDPDAEWEETRNKSQTMKAVLF